jgi:CHAT domain-containing protein/Flp pilus assembly protein TadD
LTVATLDPGQAGERAGLRAGDVLLAWERPPAPPANPEAARGSLRGVLELEEVKGEEAPRGKVVLTVLREGRAMTLEVARARWGVTAMPPLTATQDADFREGRRRIDAGDVDGGLAVWRRAVAEWAARGEIEAAGGLAVQAGAVVSDKKTGIETARALFAETRAALAVQPPVGGAEWIARLDVALGDLESESGHYAEAEEPLRRALAARRSRGPGSLIEASLLNRLAYLAHRQGDPRRAESLLAEALQIQQRTAPGSWQVTTTLNNLGVLQINRWDLAAAEATFRQVLAQETAASPDSLDVAGTLDSLGEIARDRSDFAAAEDYVRRALTIRQKVAPEDDSAGRSWHALGGLLLDEGDAAGAEAAFRQGLALAERAHANPLEIAESLYAMGTAAIGQRHFAVAARFLRRALADYLKMAPSGRGFALTLDNLADALVELGRPRQAEGYARQALKILSEIAPGSAMEATAYRDLAVIVRRRGRPAEAQRLYARALDALESQEERLGGSAQAVGGFAAIYSGYYREAIDLQVERGGAAAAFALLERFRAHQLLKLMAERSLATPAEASAALEEERRRLHAEYDGLLRQLAELSAGGAGDERAELHRRLRDVRTRQDDLATRLRAASPRLADLRYPRPLDLAAARGALDPGTLLLSYSIGLRRGLLFAVGPEPGAFRVYRLPQGAARLRDAVRRFRAFVEKGGTGAGRAAALRRAAPLSAALLAPAAGPLRRARRLQVLPDGPLHFLPFAALAAPAARPGAASGRFLVEALPIHTAASATVFAQLKEERRPLSAAGDLQVRAFGDPAYPAALPALNVEAAEPALRSALRSGLRLDPLPGSRAEVESLRALFPATARTYLGAAATEERAKAVGRDAAIVHFACHAVVDERSPLDSALALAIPQAPRQGEENGLLQVWEIFEQMRLDADLVTLSACQTALGQEMGGEGLLGLTRAFQYAGARTVLASLWSVGDAPTAELMKRFYGYLKAGQPKDEALRHAQLDLLSGRAAAAVGGESSDPFYWAGFELIGDRR